MKKTIRKTILILAGFFLFATAGAQVVQEESQTIETPKASSDFGLALGVKTNTLGFGGEVIAQIKPKIHLRLGATYFNYKVNMAPYEEFVSGTGTVNTGGISLLANFHLGRVFFLSAGAIYNLTEARVQGVSAKSVFVGSIEVQPEDVGHVDLSIKPQLGISPYAGIGIGRAISKNKVVSFAFELGTLYIKQPEAQLTTTGMLKPTSSQEQVDQLNENLSWINLYPMLSFQLSFRIL